MFVIQGGCGLLDPCEKEKTDATSNLSAQEREDITAAAQVKTTKITIKYFDCLCWNLMVIRVLTKGHCNSQSVNIDCFIA